MSHFVFNLTKGGQPRRPHPSPEAARAEAERLALKHPGEVFAVLGVVELVQANAGGAVVMSKEPADLAAGVPTWPPLVEETGTPIGFGSDAPAVAVVDGGGLGGKL